MRAILTLVLTLLPGAAFAHSGHGEVSGLVLGFLHPLGGLDHVLAMVAVGVLGAVIGGRAIYLVPLSFVAMMLAGFIAGAAGIQLSFAELGVGMSVLALGAALAMGRPIHVAAAMALSGGFAVFHGLAHGAEMPLAASGLDYALGFSTATALLHLAGLLGALGLSRLAGNRVAQAAGGVIAAAGAGLVAGWL